MGFVSSYELDIQDDASGVLRDPAALAKIAGEFNGRPLEQVIDTRQSSRAPSRKTLNGDTIGA